MKYGFIKVAAAVPAVRVADVSYNVQEIEKLISMADSQNVELLCFPELSLTGYTCQDLKRVCSDYWISRANSISSV